MKKLTVILIALLFVVSLLSGEGLSMSIWGKTVLNLLWFSSAGNPALGYQPGVIYSKWGPDMNASMYGNDGMYMSMNINWDSPFIGYQLGFQFSNWDIFGDIASVNPAGPVPPAPTQGFGSRVTTLFGSAKLIPDALSMKIGLITDLTYKYEADVGNYWIKNWRIGDLYAVPGLMFTYAPRGSGLSLSINYRVPFIEDIELVNGSFKEVQNGGAVSDLWKTVDLFASYSFPNIATVTLGTTATKATSWWDIGKLDTEYPGRPIFAGVKLMMLENVLIKAAGSYILPDDPSKCPLTFDLASITWKINPFIIKIGGQFYSDINNSSPVIAYRGAAEIDYSLGNFCLILWGNISNEFAHTYIEGGAAIQYKPIGTKVGFIFKQFTCRNGGSSSDYEWSLPIQIDIGL